MRDTSDVQRGLRLVSETCRNAGDTGDARRMAHNPAMTDSVSARQCAARMRGPTALRKPASGALRGARAAAAHALAAPIAQAIAQMALAALGLSGDPVHEPVHARDPASPASCYCA